MLSSISYLYSSMGVDLERGPVANLDNKLTENIADSNKVSESIAEKTAKLHRLLGDSDKEKGFHLGNKNLEKK